MKISACTIVKNAVKFDYPIEESIRSVLPFVDEYIINVGNCDDGTIDIISNLAEEDEKIKLFTSEWEDSSEGTTFFSSQTNEAIDNCDGDWILYLQADEVIHEDDAPKLKDWCDRADAEGAAGITFKYYHFEKDYSHIRKDYKSGGDAYDSEIRLIKNDGDLTSFGDAQSFCFLEDLLDQRGPQPAMHRAERLIDSPLHIYHYGYVKTPKQMLEKKNYLQEFYAVTHPDRNDNINGDEDGNYIFNEDLLPFEGMHPVVMEDRMWRFK